MKLRYLKSALKCNSSDVAIGTKIPFFRVLVTIEPGRSLLQFVTTNCLIFFMDKKITFNIFSFVFSIRIHNLACYLHVGENFQQFCNNIHPFENLETDSIVYFSFIPPQVDLKNET